MNRWPLKTTWLGTACLLVGMSGCDKATVETTTDADVDKSALAYKRIAPSETDPADEGPDDSMLIDSVKASMGGVRFKHFTHASNSEEGYGIPCFDCHHDAKKMEECSTCDTCHKHPAWNDPASLAGLDDNILLMTKDQDLSILPPVPFNHYTHASNQGYKLECRKCHHKEAYLVSCKDCHGDISIVEDGKVVPKAKRAYHIQCKGCHDALVQNNPVSPAPVDCYDCHKMSLIKNAPGITLERAYHLSCVGCHQKLILSNPDSIAPIKDCSGCHPGFSPRLPTASGTPAPLLIEQLEEMEEVIDFNEYKPEEVLAKEAYQGEVPKEITIKLGVQNEPTKPLSHITHLAYTGDCKSCHHEGLADPTCNSVDCHKPEESKEIFHKQCKDCHKQKGAKTSCKFCHPKDIEAPKEEEPKSE